MIVEVAEFLANDTGDNVGRSRGRERHHYADALVRVILCLSGG